ncbi:MAG: hypothetical protein NC338_05820 [Firmicutes bacterium]|nr:hypothetical protein [Bacillota bacterium]MCM1400491.1 hypothetical protein [Bacteroides sp.]MCM1476881.1 hypothetical protein [Bacteroides sp.]
MTSNSFRSSFALFAAIALCFMSLFQTSAATPAASAPDFAYPKTVIANSDKALDIALRDGNETAALRALMDYSLAQTNSGSEHTPAVLEKFNAVMPKLQTPQARAFANLLLATIYQNLFNADSYTYNSRNIPLTPLSESYTEWSGDQFRNVISTLCAKALTDPSALQNINIADYTQVVDIARPDMVYFPTLYDFVAHRSIAILSSIGRFSPCMGLVSLSPRAMFIITPGITASSPFAQQILDIYASLLRFHSGKTAPEIYCDIQRIQFVTSNIYPNLSDRAEDTALELYRNLFDEHASSEYSGDALIAMGPYLTNIDSRHANNVRIYYNMLQRFAHNFRGFHRLDCIIGLIDAISAKRLSLNAPGVVAPGCDFNVKVSSTNVPEFKVKVYNVSGVVNKNSGSLKHSSLAKLTPIQEIAVSLNRFVPFTADTTLTFSLPAYGVYAIVPDFTGGSKDRWMSTVRVTNLGAGAISSQAGTEAFVIDPLTGAPVQKADILLGSDSNNKSEKRMGATDSNGFYTFSNVTNGHFRPVKGKDVWADQCYFYTPGTPGDKWQYHSNIFTDLPLYHPGDSLKWCATVYKSRPGERKLMVADSVRAILYNTNSVEVASSTLFTDGWGRINGSFAIPKGDLTGQYRIVLDTHGSHAGTQWFMVSDYKLPTFFITMDKVATGFPESGDVTLSGTVTTYSGMNLGGVPVQAVVSVSPSRWWWRTNMVDFCTLRDTTDAQGRFKMVLSKAMIDNSPAPDGMFNATVSATSASGESQQTQCSFTTGNAYAINTSVPDAIDVTNPVTLKRYYKVESSEGNVIDTPLSYRLTNNRTPHNTMDGAVTDREDWNSLPASTYTLKVFSSALAADTATSTVVIYTPHSSTSPVDAPLWSPVSSLSVEKDSKCQATVFAAHADTHALLIGYCGNKVTEKKWIKLNRGANKVTLQLPNGEPRVTFTLGAIRNFATSTLRFDVALKNVEKSLTIKAESFRNKLIPGQGETWTFRTLNADSAGTESAMILSMYNAALDAICPSSRQIYFSRTRVPGASIEFPGFSSRAYNTIYHNERTPSCPEIEMPSFLTYGLTFSPVIHIRGTRLYKMERAESAVGAADAMTEEVMAVNEMADYAAPMASAEMKVALTDAGTETSSEASTPEQTEPTFKYRESESTLAFFNPMLATDANGRLSFSFTVPNANTQWNFTALAYDRDLSAAEFNREVVASKPLMVQPNLPRFLRWNDTSTISASVMNNSSEATDVEVTVEYFNPATGEILASPQVAPLHLEPQQTSAISTTFTAPANLALAGYRVKVSNGTFADGEQALIPILESSAPVIESVPFYMAPDSLHFSTRLPDYPADATVTLQYCDNPIWFVVTALPGLSSSESRTAPQAAQAIFSAAVARGILDTYPLITDALKQWTDSNKSDSTLISMLQCNADLKTFLLQATPWLSDASSETERMNRLALLLDPDNINQAITTSVTLLKKLQRASGGWAWVAQYDKASQWATEQSLLTLGHLNRLGFLPQNKELRSMIDKALDYCQKEVEKDYARNPRGTYPTFVNILDRFSNFKPSTTATGLVNKYIQQLISGWKKSALPQKANAAILLARHGYKPVAGEILKSIGQFAETSPERGMWWPLLDDFASGTMTQLTLTARILEAYHEINPTGKEIDPIRQWLILQKEARDWGSGTAATDVVAAVLLTSPKWVAASSLTATEIKVGNGSVTPTAAESFSGNFRNNITPLRPSGKMLTVNRTDRTPAWGSVVSRAVMQMDKVKASGCDAITIEKRLYVQQGDKWIEAPKVLSVGQKVKIELIIRADRAMDYVAVADTRAACFEPVEQLPTPVWAEGLCFYRENGNSATNLFISTLPKGTYRLSYEMWVNNAGTYASGIATVQSQSAPQLTAHSSGSTISVK